jgi:glycosyltransferase involved in cell wall biosynthesis
LDDRFAGANCLYAIDNRDLDLLKLARASGLTIIYEQIICPSGARILREERDLFPGIERHDAEEDVRRGVDRDIEIFRLANAVICASDFVRDDVLSLAGPVRAKVIPYGISDEWLQVPRSPIPGRILFVGTVGLRKGNHYLAEATRILKSRGVQCDVRVIGPYDSRAISRPEFRGPTYLGQVPRESIRSEFAKADVFALPTVADGFAIAHLEALACGVPVVTTPNCGSQVRDGQDGFIVPIRDPRTLADRLEQLISDRVLRDQMSGAARQRAAELSWATFGNRLLAATRDAMNHAAGRG